MAVGGAGLLTALGQTQASAATTTTATPDWLNVTDTAYGGGADNTGSADSTTAFQDAISAAVTAGGGVVYIPAGKYKITSTLTCTTVPVYFVGDGAWATTIDFAGSGDCLRIYDSTAWGSRTKWGGGVIGLTIDGASATGTATGVHVGDLLQYELDLTVQNFTKSGSIGVHLDNNYYWTEQFYGRVYAQNCASHVVFDLTSTTSSTATGSFERCEFDIYVNQEDANFDGVVFRNGAFTGNSSLKIRGNFGESGSAVTSAALRLSGTSTIAESLLDIGVECASGTYTPQTIVFGSTAHAIIDCYGSLNFGLAGSTFSKSNNTGQVSNFLGHVTGDTSLPQDNWVSCTPTSTTINTAFLSGVTGHVALRKLPTGSEVMVTWALDIAGGTALTAGKTIFTLLADGIARFAYTDNKIIPGNNSGGGLSGNVYAPGYLTATGAFQYSGPAYTSSGTSWWYGQGVYTLYTG
jgi:hypothetical protein